MKKAIAFGLLIHIKKPGVVTKIHTRNVNILR